MHCQKKFTVHGSRFIVKKLFPVLFFASCFLYFSPSPIFADWTFDATPPSCGSWGFSGTPIVGNRMTVTINCPDSGGSGNDNTILKINGTTVSTSLASSPANISYSFIPQTAGTYTFTATALDIAGNKGESSTQFTFQNSSPPTCSIGTSPSSPQYPNTTVTVYVSGSSTSSSVNSLNLTINGQTVRTSNSSNLTYSWVPTSTGSYSIAATVGDRNGMTGSCSTGTYSIITTPQTPLEPGITILQSCTNTTLYSPEPYLKVSWSQVNPPVSYVVFTLWDYYYFSKSVSSSTTSTLAPQFFTGYYNYYGNMFVYPGQTYNVYLYNGNWGPPKAVYIAPCGAPPKPQVTYSSSCVTGPYSQKEFTLSWIDNPDPAKGAQIADRNTPNIWKYYSKNFTGTANQANSTTGPNNFSGSYIYPNDNSFYGQSLVMQPGLSYGATTSNNWTSSEEAAVSLPLCPNCNAGISCTGGCAAPSNTCNTDNAAQSGCQYTSSTSGGTCIPAAAPNLPCGRIDNCTAPNTCSGQSCLPPCNTGLECTGTCSAPANTCRDNNGTKGNCTYKSHTTAGSSCIPTAAPPSTTLPCTDRNACVSPNICTNPGPTATCELPPPPSPPSQSSLSATCSTPDQSGTSTANLYIQSAVPGATYYRGRVGTQPPVDSSYLNITIGGLTPNSTYSWGVRACNNNGGCSSETPGSGGLVCEPNPAFLQTTGGDVHSNR